MKKRFQFKVTGRVQGVGFRFFTQEKAKSLSLSGWVKNSYDGSVEGVVEGEKNLCEKFINFLRKGPSFSFVEKVIIRDVEIKSPIEETFKIIY